MPMKPTSTTQRVLVICAVSCAAFLSGCATSPTGNSQLMLVSESKLVKTGNASYKKMKEKLPISENQQAKQYVTCVAHAITDQASSLVEDVPSDWEVTLFDKDAVNAFALPGGNIGVFTGLLDITEGQAQLAAVLGHEVSHVLADHANARVSTNMATNTVLQVVGAFFGGDTIGKVTMAALGLGAQVGIMLPYSRTQETEADIMGLKLMARAGFDPRAAVALWRNMAQASKKAPPEFLSTHPSDQSRINVLQSHLSEVMPTYKRARSHGLTPNCR